MSAPDRPATPAADPPAGGADFDDLRERLKKEYVLIERRWVDLAKTKIGVITGSTMLVAVLGLGWLALQQVIQDKIKNEVKEVTKPIAEQAAREEARRVAVLEAKDEARLSAREVARESAERYVPQVVRDAVAADGVKAVLAALQDRLASAKAEESAVRDLRRKFDEKLALTPTFNCRVFGYDGYWLKVGDLLVCSGQIQTGPDPKDPTLRHFVGKFPVEFDDDPVFTASVQHNDGTQGNGYPFVTYETHVSKGGYRLIAINTSRPNDNVVGDTTSVVGLRYVAVGRRSAPVPTPAPPPWADELIPFKASEVK